MSAGNNVAADGVVQDVNLHCAGGLVGADVDGHCVTVGGHARDDIAAGVLEAGDHAGIGGAEVLAAELPDFAPVMGVDRAEVGLDHRGRPSSSTRYLPRA